MGGVAAQMAGWLKELGRKPVRWWLVVAALEKEGERKEL
jgi:hypothetical protein